jgi:hypothetical protein
MDFNEVVEGNPVYLPVLDDIVVRARTIALARSVGLGKRVRWKLDREKGLATPEDSSVLKGFAAPVRPMLGGLAPVESGAAPNPGASDVSSAHCVVSPSPCRACASPR